MYFKLPLKNNYNKFIGNYNILYVTSPMGFNNGFASEYNHYLIGSTINAITSGRRLVYLRSNRTWEYDCNSKSGWGCYFRFRCGHPRGVEPKDMNFTAPLSGSLINPGSTFQSTILGYGNVIDMSRIINAFKKVKMIDEQLQCSVSTSTTVATSIIAKYLYQLQPEVKSSIKQINSRYHHLIQSGYFSLQIRLTDKKVEMPKQTWLWMNNANIVTNYMKPFFEAQPKIKNLFIGNRHSFTTIIPALYLTSMRII